ncbi:hypothetical protein LIER_40878 [Lithospermum erythrorhizon]|uniref:Uncharacterized protein n=1 Tax=Lithospermum erythrorhizon TaxID=34254 RepID=A0AAV3R565_LITER
MFNHLLQILQMRNLYYQIVEGIKGKIMQKMREDVEGWWWLFGDDGRKRVGVGNGGAEDGGGDGGEHDGGGEITNMK